MKTNGAKTIQGSADCTYQPTCRELSRYDVTQRVPATVAQRAQCSATEENCKFINQLHASDLSSMFLTLKSHNCLAGLSFADA